MPNETLSRFVLLPDLKMIRCYKTTQGFVCEAEKQRTDFEICPRCASKCSSTYDHRTVTVKDEPLRRSPCILKIKKRRLWCPQCRKPFTESVDGIFPRRKTTQRMRRALLWACETFSDLKRVQSFFHCSAGLIYASVFEQLKLKIKEYQYPWPKIIGVDEHFFARGKDDTRTYFTVFVDILKHRVREAVYGKKVEIVERKINHIEGRENVLWLVMDLSTTYLKLASDIFPNAQIVADKFHVLQFFHKLIRKIRHQTKLDEKKEQPSLRLLLKSRKDLNYWKRQEIDRWIKAYPDLDFVYRLKEKAMEFYRTKGFERAKKSFKKILQTMSQSNLPEVRSLQKTLSKWSQAILNYFKTGLTNAMSEGFNRVASLVKNRGFGYRSPENYRLRFLSACL